MNKRELGNHYESLVCDFLSEKSIHVLERNFRCRSGEIDIVADDHGVLAFVEVKYRTGTSYGCAQSAVDFKKQKTICRVSDFYCKRYKIDTSRAIRYDVAAININSEGAVTVDYIENAFSYLAEGNWRTNRCSRMF